MFTMYRHYSRSPLQDLSTRALRVDSCLIATLIKSADNGCANAEAVPQVLDLAGPTTS